MSVWRGLVKMQNQTRDRCIQVLSDLPGNPQRRLVLLHRIELIEPLLSIFAVGDDA